MLRNKGEYMERETPRSVLFADLKQFGCMSYTDAATLLLNDLPIFGGISPRARLSDRTFLSRSVVHVSPTDPHEELFGDLPQASLTLFGRIQRGARLTRDQVGDHYRTQAAAQMMDALVAWGMDANLYQGTLQRIARLDLPDEDDRQPLYLLLFVATGCLQNVRDAVQVLDDFSDRKLAAALLSTQSATDLSRWNLGTPALTERMGLLRMVDGAAKLPVHELNPGPGGTVVGSLPPEQEAITDVGPDVSRRHLRIWYSGGVWYAQGLGSTNGSWLVSGADGSVRVIEEPRARRAQGQQAQPVPIKDGDYLRLARSTEFMVMKVVS